MTPSIQGFQLGLSYLPDNQEDNNGARDSDAELTDGYTIGASFNHDFDGDFNLECPLVTVLSLTVRPVTRIRMPSLPVSPSVSAASQSVVLMVRQKALPTKKSTVSLLEQLETGPWGFSVNYLHSDGDGTTTGNVITNDGDHDSFSVNGKYTFGPGVTAAATLGHSEISTDNTAAGTNDEIDGTYFVVGMKLSF